MTRDLEVGSLVISKCGRDQGRNYIVWEIVDGTFVYLVDGDTRRLQNPKRKNIKHLHVTKKVAEELRNKIKLGEKLSNMDIRKMIKKYSS